MTEPADVEPRTAELIREVRAELVRLRKGPGVYSPRLEQQLGPRLRALVDPDHDEGPVLRSELALLLDRVATEVLSPASRTAALFALGVHRSHGDRSLQGRLEHVAALGKVSLRTVQRRVDDAFAAMAAALAAELAGRERARVAPPGWRVDALHSRLTFSGRRPTLVERRTVVALTPGLAVVTGSLSFPRTGDAWQGPLRVVAGDGCAVKEVEERHPGFWEVALELPSALPVGGRHAYTVTYEAPPGATMMPFYGFAPFRAAHGFSAEVVFDDPGTVEGVWELDGVPQPAAMDGSTPLGARVPFAADGRTVRVAFSGLVQGLAYGVHWRWRA